MANQEWFGGTLVVAALLLLAASGRVGWLLILLPVSVLLAYGVTSAGNRKTKLTPEFKKR